MGVSHSLAVVWNDLWANEGRMRSGEAVVERARARVASWRVMAIVCDVIVAEYVCDDGVR